MKTHIQPLRDRVLVSRTKEPETTPGGLFIPDPKKERPPEGTVVAVGPGRVLDNGTVVRMEVRVGDRILFGKFSGTEVKMDSEEYLLLNEGDILATLTINQD